MWSKLLSMKLTKMPSARVQSEVGMGPCCVGHCAPWPHKSITKSGNEITEVLTGTVYSMH